VPESWKPPSGPPNGAPVHPNDAKREIDDAVVAAQRVDQTLRSQLATVAASRVVAGARLVAATTEVDEATALAKRALTKANEAARAGQRAEAAKLTGAARVFAVRLRDGRAAVADAESTVAGADRRRVELDAALTENVGRLQAVAAARLPILGGRKARGSQTLVDETVAALSAPATGLVARAEADAHAALEAAAEADDGLDALEVADDDLEREVDDAGTDEILDALRTELGLPPVGPAPTAAAPADREAAGESDGRDTEAPAGDADPGRPAAAPVPHASGARS
jgi:hypothetical protein